jgi:hypothetical protein
MLPKFIAQRLEQMLSHPDCWGGPEAYELQALLLLEMHVASFRLAAEDESLRTLNELYAAFLRDEYPALGARPLSAITDDYAAIAQALRRFRDSLVHGVHSAESRRALGHDIQLPKNSTVMPRVN